MNKEGRYNALIDGFLEKSAGIPLWGKIGLGALTAGTAYSIAKSMLDPRYNPPPNSGLLQKRLGHTLGIRTITKGMPVEDGVRRLFEGIIEDSVPNTVLDDPLINILQDQGFVEEVKAYLSAEILETYGVEIPDTKMDEVKTLRDIANYVKSESRGG